MPTDDSPASAELTALRQQIDSLDAQIVGLLNARANVVVEIGKLKQQTNAPIYAPDREKFVLEKVRTLNKGPLPDRCLEAVYRELMSGSFALEKTAADWFPRAGRYLFARRCPSQVRQQC